MSDSIRRLHVLGEGRYGSVHTGVDVLLQRRVMVKCVTSDVDAALRGRLLDEARALSSIDHPNVPRVYAYAEEPGHDRFTLELIEGTPLREAAPALPFRERVRIAVAIASALATLHRAGLVHGLLSPDAIVLTNAREVKLTGFALTSPHIDDASSADAAATNAFDRYALGQLLQFLFPRPDAELQSIIGELLRDAPSDR